MIKGSVSSDGWFDEIMTEYKPRIKAEVVHAVTNDTYTNYQNLSFYLDFKKFLDNPEIF